ncbi:beta-propeller domain-containing protein [Bacillus sp. T3]|uniref:beta-propeller domain-containing protein n=1 Tax=Bacillus sp. T3 TaxID=467262 RepID=UPI002981C744|nr:beta-propeller domain-containing protein [Bacillus sp. T3]
MKKIFVLCGILIGVMLVASFFLNNRFDLVNEQVKQVNENASKDNALPRIDSKEKLTGYFKQILENGAENSYIFGAKEEKSSNLAAADSSGKQDVSETNVQVEGVDEADLIKTDGQYIYQIGQNKVDIIQAAPVEAMKYTGKITFDNNFAPTQLFLYQNQLLVIGNTINISSQTEKAPAGTVTDTMMAPAFQATNAILYNVENPQKPEKIREIKLDGSYVSSRRIDGIVYLVTNHFPSYWLLAENENVDIRPMIKDTAVSTKEHPIDYNEIQYFPDSNEANFTIIAALNLEKPTEEASFTTYLGSGSQMYMSKKNLYFAVPKYLDQSIVEKGEMISPDSTIYKFAINDTKVSFHSQAEIKGTILNQFSMDEHHGHFRLVTTKGYAWDEKQPSTNQLYIFDKNLKQVGEISNLGQGERIYSARFLGDRIYMVTFKETDPLFVIDASNPAQPKVLGELKIPGLQ